MFYYVIVTSYSLNVNEWKFHSPIEWNSCKPLKKEWFCTLNSKFPLIKSENHSKKSELPLIWGVKRRKTRKRIVLRLTPQTSGNSLFLESFSLYMSGNLLFNVQNHSFLSGLQEFHSFGEWNFHSFTFREYVDRFSWFWYQCKDETLPYRAYYDRPTIQLYFGRVNFKIIGEW